MDFSMPSLFNRAPNVLVKLNTWDLIYDCPWHIWLYLQKSADYFQQHNIQQRIQTLLESDQDNETAEALDRDITRGMITAKRQCRSHNRSPWSRDLHNAMTKLYILKRVLSQWYTSYDMSVSITTIQLSLSEPISIPTDIKSINHALRDAQRERREAVRTSYRRRKDFQQEKIMALQLIQVPW